MLESCLLDAWTPLCAVLLMFDIIKLSVEFWWWMFFDLFILDAFCKSGASIFFVLYPGLDIIESLDMLESWRWLIFEWWIWLNGGGLFEFTSTRVLFVIGDKFLQFTVNRNLNVFFHNATGFLLINRLLDSANCDAFLRGGAGGVLCRIPFLTGTAGSLRIACVLIGVIDLLKSESIDPLLEIFLLKRLCSKLKTLTFFFKMKGESVKLLWRDSIVSARCKSDDK